jgi:DNA-binding transcriptional MerR regulator
MRTISDTAAQAGVSADTLRYYERIGLLAAPDRTPSGYRLYDPSTPERVRLIKGAQRIGLRLDAIKNLLDILDRGACPCGHTRRLVEQRVADVDRELRDLQALRGDLVRLLAGLDDCPEPPAGACWCASELTKNGGEG